MVCGQEHTENKVSIQQLKNPIPDEIIDVDTAIIKQYLDDEAWIHLTELGIYLSLTYNLQK